MCPCMVFPHLVTGIQVGCFPFVVSCWYSEILIWEYFRCQIFGLGKLYLSHSRFLCSPLFIWIAAIFYLWRIKLPKTLPQKSFVDITTVSFSRQLEVQLWIRRLTEFNFIIIVAVFQGVGANLCSNTWEHQLLNILANSWSSQFFTLCWIPTFTAAIEPVITILHCGAKWRKKGSWAMAGNPWREFQNLHWSGI